MVSAGWGVGLYRVSAISTSTLRGGRQRGASAFTRTSVKSHGTGGRSSATASKRGIVGADAGDSAPAKEAIGEAFDARARAAPQAKSRFVTPHGSCRTPSGTGGRAKHGAWSWRRNMVAGNCIR